MLLSSVLLYAMPAWALALPSPFHKRDVSAELLAEFNLFEQYSAAAYCDNENGPGLAITCSESNCPLVEAAEATTLATFENSFLFDVTGFVALDPTNKLVVVSFRGSVSVWNWIADITFALTTSDLCDGCLVHTGFWGSWEQARAGVMAAIMAAADDYPDYTLVLTGHSLGAAIATLAASNLRNEGYTAALYNYGSPRVGNPVTAAYIESQSGGNYRVTHTDDPVPKLPPTALAFAHISPEYWIKSATSVAVKSSDIEVITTVDANVGNEATGGLDIDAHGWYFNDISACA